MFEEMLKALEQLDQQGVTVSIPTDAEGYYDRACPSQSCEFEFKIHEDDWKEKVRDEEVFCAFCRHGAPSDQWFTESQIEYINEVAKQQVGDTLNRAMQVDAKKFNRKQPRDSFITMKMSVDRKAQHNSLPSAVADAMEIKIVCPACGCRFAVVGAAYFCPACGHNSIDRDFWRSIDRIPHSLEAVEQIKATISDKDTAENVSRTLIESCLLSLVTAFQRYAEFLYLRHPNAISPKRNSFQNLEAGSALWKSAYGKEFADYIESEKLILLNIFFQQRHLLAHKDGIVDADYIEKSADQSYKIGQRIVIKESVIRECLSLVHRLTKGIEMEAVQDE